MLKIQSELEKHNMGREYAYKAWKQYIERSKSDGGKFLMKLLEAHEIITVEKGDGVPMGGFFKPLTGSNGEPAAFPTTDKKALPEEAEVK